MIGMIRVDGVVLARHCQPFTKKARVGLAELCTVTRN